MIMVQIRVSTNSNNKHWLDSGGNLKVKTVSDLMDQCVYKGKNRMNDYYEDFILCNWMNKIQFNEKGNSENI